MEGGDATAEYGVGVRIGETLGVDEVQWESTDETNDCPTKDDEEDDPEYSLGEFAIRRERRLGSEGRDKRNRREQEGPKRRTKRRRAQTTMRLDD